MQGSALHSKDGAARALGSAPRPARFPRLWRVALGAAAALIFTAGLAFMGGFLWFVRCIPTEEIALERDADGIVVLTGGASRIADAVELLASGHGKRLLITGVHRATSARELARAMPRHERLLACCVDLDHSALNTFGNATETRRWAESLGFRSLIVVTSAYHMPRSMAELGRQLPGFQLIAFPVVTDRLRAEPWWASLATTKLLFSEYVKYMLTQARMRLEPAPDTTEVARTRNGIGG
ncbi:MAG: YdcF family protein [Variibacter sp.]|nr:YdcF family protein [Variibacter sp.]